MVYKTQGCILRILRAKLFRGGDFSKPLSRADEPHLVHKFLWLSACIVKCLANEVGEENTEKLPSLSMSTPLGIS